MERAVLKSNAKRQLKGKWSLAVITTIVSGIIIGIFPTISNWVESGAIKAVFAILGILVDGAIVYGYSYFSLKFASENEAEFNDLFSGFGGKVFWKTVGLYILMAIIVSIGFAILIIPGIILALMFSQAFYILCEDNDKSVIQCLKESSEIMKGHKVEYFVLLLSFIGWAILASITCGIAVLWVCPYQNVTLANYYLALTKSK